MRTEGWWWWEGGRFIQTISHQSSVRVCRCILLQCRRGTDSIKVCAVVVMLISNIFESAQRCASSSSFPLNTPVLYPSPLEPLLARYHRTVLPLLRGCRRRYARGCDRL
jgi:hypothetical protein